MPSFTLLPASCRARTCLPLVFDSVPLRSAEGFLTSVAAAHPQTFGLTSHSCLPTNLQLLCIRSQFGCLLDAQVSQCCPFLPPFTHSRRAVGLPLADALCRAMGCGGSSLATVHTSGDDGYPGPPHTILGKRSVSFSRAPAGPVVVEEDTVTREVAGDQVRDARCSTSQDSQAPQCRQP